MKLFSIAMLGLLFSINVWSFESGSYSGSNTEMECWLDLEKQTDSVRVQYQCVTPDGLVIESQGFQTYAFGSFSQEVEDETGRYLVSGSGSDQLLEYKIVKLTSNNSTWLEQIKNLGDSKIHYNMSLDDNFFINMTFTKDN